MSGSTFPPSMQKRNIAAEAAEAGIFIAPSAAFATSDIPAPGMRVNVAFGNAPQFLRWLAEAQR